MYTYIVVVDILVSELYKDVIGAHLAPPPDGSVPRPRGEHHRLARSRRQRTCRRRKRHLTGRRLPLHLRSRCRCDDLTRRRRPNLHGRSPWHRALNWRRRRWE